jgi:hypothetical protein
MSLGAACDPHDPSERRRGPGQIQLRRPASVSLCAWHPTSDPYGILATRTGHDTIERCSQELPCDDSEAALTCFQDVDSYDLSCLLACEPW